MLSAIVSNGQFLEKNCDCNGLLEKYDRLLIKTAEVKSDLNFKARELELKITEISNLGLEIEDYVEELTGVRSQIQKMVDYGKYLEKRLKKEKRKAWFNGIWQGIIVGAAIIVSILII